MSTDREQLVLDHLWLVDYMAWRLQYYSIPIDERRSIARTGLVEAALHYDASKGAKFSTYAGVVIKCTMIKELSRISKHQSVSLDKPDEDSLTLLDKIPDNEVGYTAIEMSDLLQALPDEQRQAIELIVCQGMTPTKAAKIMHRRRPWLEDCVQQGLRTLRSLYVGGV